MKPEEERQGPVIRDRRRIDPATGQVRDTGDAGSQRGSAPGAGQGGGQHRPGRHSVSRPGGAAAGGSSAGPGSGQPGTGGSPGREPGSANGGSSAPGEDTGPAGGRPAGASGAGGTPTAAGATAAGTSGGRGAPATEAPGDAASSGDDRAKVMLAERTADLQRLQAEYANYRKRVERDRIAVREQALANVLHALLPVLDDIGRAREHGELTGGFKSVGESLEGIAVKLGLTTFGESGDPFDPTLHEALMHSYSADVTEPTAVQILQPGYKVGERIIRPARVAVAEPADDDDASEVGAGSADLSGADTDGDGATGSQPGAEAHDTGAKGTSKE
jgi:molecular chaperone GrpE